MLEFVVSRLEAEAAMIQGAPVLFAVAEREKGSSRFLDGNDPDEGTSRLLRPLSEGDLARTVADLAGQNGIAPEHVAAAMQYRSLDRTPRR